MENVSHNIQPGLYLNQGIQKRKWSINLKGLFCVQEYYLFFSFSINFFSNFINHCKLFNWWGRAWWTRQSGTGSCKKARNPQITINQHERLNGQQSNSPEGATDLYPLYLGLTYERGASTHFKAIPRLLYVLNPLLLGKPKRGA